MRLRYNCPPSYKHVEDIPLWKIATTAFLECIKTGVSVVEGLENGNWTFSEFDIDLPFLALILRTKEFLTLHLQILARSL